MEACSKGPRRREMLRKRQPSLIKKANQLHTLCNVSVALLIRLDHEILFYSSDTNTNYSAIVAVSSTDPFSVIWSLMIIQALHWDVSTKIKILNLDDLVEHQKSISFAENHNSDILHNRTHSLFAKLSSGSSICHHCSPLVSTDKSSLQEPNTTVGPAMFRNKEGSSRVLSTQRKEEEATIGTNRLNCLRKRDRVCLESTSRVTRFSARELRRQTRSVTRSKKQHRC